MYDKFIIEPIYRPDGQITSFSTLYGIQGDNATIINTDEIETINTMYQALTNIDTNHANETDPNKYLLLSDFYEWEYTDNDMIDIDGRLYPYEITLSPDIPDAVCNRVNINGFYFHF